MPIVQFENEHDTPLKLVIEPQGETREIPPRATAAVRYALRDGDEDRSHVGFAAGRIEFWCNADDVEIEVAQLWPCEWLSRDICVGGGWCGGVIDGQPTHFHDLLPEAGTVTASSFAQLVVRADGWPDGEPMPDKSLHWLETKFVEHMGAAEVDVEELRRLPMRPFDTART